MGKGTHCQTFPAGDERVLDIGCGDGKITAAIAASLPDGRAVGIDNSADMIRFASDHFPQEQYPGLSFILMDAQRLAFTEEFDIVFSNAALHWLTDHRPLLAGIRRSLRPGGADAGTDGRERECSCRTRIFDGMCLEPLWRSYYAGFSFSFAFFGPEEYRGWIAESGLSPTRAELINKDMACRTRDEFAGWIRTPWLPHLQRIPEDLHMPFINEIIDRYLARFPADEGGTIHIGMVRLEAEAIRMV